MKPIRISEEELIKGIKNSTLKEDRVYLLEKKFEEGTLLLPLAYNKFEVDPLPEEEYEGTEAISMWSVFKNEFKNNKKVEDTYDSEQKTHNYIDWQSHLKEELDLDLEARMTSSPNSVTNNWMINRESKGISEKAIKKAIDGLVKDYFAVRSRFENDLVDLEYLSKKMDLDAQSKNSLGRIKDKVLDQGYLEPFKQEIKNNVLSYFTKK